MGKALGIFLFSFVSSKLGIAAMPSHSTYKQLLGVGMLGGIGFTMSIFTSSLAYDQPELLVISKVAIITGSIGSSVLGFLYLSRLKPGTAVKRSAVDYQSYLEKIERIEQQSIAMA